MMRGRGQPGRREAKALPEEGPYRAFVGNLPFDTTQGDFDTLFDGLTINGVQMMRDRETDQFKGFAYVEFGSRDALSKALIVDGAMFDNRVVRVDVADDRGRPQRNRSPKRGGRAGFDQHRGGPPRGQYESRGGDRESRPFRGRYEHRGGDRTGPPRSNFDLQNSSDSAPRLSEPRKISESAGNDRLSGASGDESFQVVQNRKPHSSRGSRGGERPFSHEQHRGGDRDVSHVPKHSNRGGIGSRRAEPSASQTHAAPATADPARPKLNLKPRTTDPGELERIRQKEEEAHQARLEKIYTAK